METRFGINVGDRFNINWMCGTVSNNVYLIFKDFDWKLWWCSNDHSKGFYINPLSSAIASIEKVED